MTEPAAPSSPASFPFVEAETLRRVAIVCHRNADADSYLSAYALAALFASVSPQATVDIITPDGMGIVAQRLRETFTSETLEESDRDYDLFVAVDIGHTALLKGWLEKIKASRAFKVLVDHHPVQKDSIYDSQVVDPGATSASEVVYCIFRERGITPQKVVAQALLVGIMSDSQHLAIAGEATLRAVVALLENGADLLEARRILRSPPDYGEVIARLKGAKRSRIFKVGDWVVVTSHIGSFQAQVARGLVSLGADVAVVAGDVEDETRVSLRAGQRFRDATNLHLGVQLAETLAGAEGYGGGHPTAASFTCSLGEEVALDKSVALIAELLGQKAVEVR
jgi:nanoRNase/pAp phosphatase (c-di-AMP/oligoRNAs hydrolase)